MIFTPKIANSKEELEAIIQLRYRILRQPWNKSIESATDEQESESTNAYVANEEGKVLACGRLQKNEGRTGQIRYMAVDAGFQGKGLGKAVCLLLEEQARSMGLLKIELQARENAVEFYKSNGYSVKEKSFKLWDIIQHYLMEKEL